MFQNISPLGTLDVTLRGKDISLPILRSTDCMTEPMPLEETIDEVEAVLPIETPDSSLEQDADLFTEEEDAQVETFDRRIGKLMSLPPRVTSSFPKGEMFWNIFSTGCPIRMSKSWTSKI